ncbi:hypothetical protein DNTS_013227 [Danionella cerebrum]|uniref:Uncharacterized protein n=1 Tax=Danionella cerebrum TaxID=2873325 RepID=A0A553Q5S6_9TELE|nr:hypothetical protein DNTS_013227 [Danionella translucida]TRY85275.1 hypothetical protein DNTS_013227 [Danionella translucida]
MNILLLFEGWSVSALHHGLAVQSSKLQDQLCSKFCFSPKICKLIVQQHSQKPLSADEDCGSGTRALSGISAGIGSIQYWKQQE